jgi:hypothetical protein
MQAATSQYYFGLVQNCDNLLILCRMRPAAPCYGQRPSACRAMCFLPTDSRVPDGSACAPARRLARHGAGPVVGRCEHAATPDLPAAHTDGRQRRLLLDLLALQRACCARMVSMCSLFDEAQCPRKSTDTPQPRLRHRRPAACRRGPARDGERGGGRADVRDGALRHNMYAGEVLFQERLEHHPEREPPFCFERSGCQEEGRAWGHAE